MRNLFLLALVTLTFSSCSTLFWNHNSYVPIEHASEIASKALVLDFEGNICPKEVTVSDNTPQVELTTKYRVPKFASKSARNIPIQFLCFINATDTIIYQLNFKVQKPVPLGGIAGGALGLSLIPMFNEFWGEPTILSVYFAGFIAVSATIYIDIPTGVLAYLDHNSTPYPIKAAWKYQGSVQLPMQSAPPQIQKALRSVR
jgi:hypothetical protein